MWLLLVCLNKSFALTYVVDIGASGCGKSTIIQLLERFYDVTDGQLVSFSSIYDLNNSMKFINRF